MEATIRQALASAESELHTEQLAQQLGIARHTASKYLAILHTKGEVRCRKVGNAKLWRSAPTAEPTPSEDQARAERVFTELHPPLDEEAAVVEAERCLDCGGPLSPAPCTTACPTSIDVPRFIQEIRQGRPLDAARTIFSANVLGGSCARVCPVEELCEGACVLEAEGRRAVDIRRLQRYATDRALEVEGPSFVTDTTDETEASVPRTDSTSVAVVGAGPAGLGCAAELARLGHRVVVYERKPHPGGLITDAIAPYKQLVDPLPDEVARIESLGVAFRFGVTVGRDMTLEALERRYDAVFLGIGLGPDIQANLPGEDLNGVWDSLAFIERVKEGRFAELDLGTHVAVIGGGNTAIDAAREAKRLGGDNVTVLYRRTEEQMPAYDHEIEEAKAEGVDFQFLTSPTRFVGNAERVEGVECVEMRLGAPDASGRPKPEPIEGSAFIVEADTVVKAIGQRPWTERLEAWNVAHDRGWIETRRRRTSRAKVYAGGDCVNGGATVVEAVRDGRSAARRMHEAIVGETPPQRIATIRATTEQTDGQTHYAQGSAYYVGTEPRLCKGCELCVNSCPQGVLDLDAKGKIVMTDPSECVFCGVCEARCPDFAIWVVKDADEAKGQRNPAEVALT
ncbi:MAG: FAD-dependent oxidoreductase [Candidatus Bipolaricaulia bacterium]